MDRKLIVTLLKKHIQELEMITEGFLEMTEYPKPIITLARKKTEDILEYISQLEELKSQNTSTDLKETDFSSISLDESPIVLKETEEETVLNIEIVESELTEEIITISEKVDHVEFEQEDLVSYEIDLDKEDSSFEDEQDEAIDEESNDNDKVVLIESEIIENDTKDVVEMQVEETIITQVTTKEKVTLHNMEIEKTTIADSHNNKKIDDIRQAISIGDRFRFQRELFGGNGEVLNKTLSYLNQLSNFEEAHTYLKNKFKWDESDETVENFYQIVKRRYL